jgi:hypothetical protein
VELPGREAAAARVRRRELPRAQVRWSSEHLAMLRVGDRGSLHVHV